MSWINCDEGNFESEVLKSNLPVLVDFWTEWCGPCKMLESILKELSDEYAGRLKVVRVEANKNPGLSSKYKVYAVPTLILFRNGEVAETIIGVKPKEVLRKKIDAIV